MDQRNEDINVIIELGKAREVRGGTCLTSDLLGASLFLGVGLLGDPLAALVRVGKRVPWLLVEIRMAPSSAGFGLVVYLSTLIGEPLAQPYASSFLALHSLLYASTFYLSLPLAASNFLPKTDLVLPRSSPQKCYQVRMDLTKRSVVMASPKFHFCFAFWIGPHIQGRFPW